ncbi:MAG: sulfotransferase [Verrucomicrobiota bacterium]
MKPRFVIFGSMRTGSNYLISLLNQVDEIICHGEVFNPGFVGLREDLEVHFEHDIKDVSKRDDNIELFFNRVVEAHSDKVTGFKIFPGHHSYAINRVLGDKSIRRVHLKRDILTSYISLCQAKESGVWKIDSCIDGNVKSLRRMRRKRARYDCKIRFVSADYEEYRNKIQQFYRKLEADSEKNDIPLFEIWYKDLHNSEKLDELLEFIGVEERGHLFDEIIVKQSDSDLEERVDNFGEMLDYLTSKQMQCPVITSVKAGREFMALQRIDEAESAYLSATEYYPERAEGHVGLAQIAAKRKDWEGAIASWRFCLERFSEQGKPFWFVELGRALVTLGRIDEAEAVYRSAIERYDDRAEGYVGLAQIAASRKDREIAATCWQDCFDRFIEQARPFWFVEAGRVLAVLERIDEAEAVYQSATERYPNRVEGYIGLARIAAQRMDWQCSLERWDFVFETYRDKMSDSDLVSRAQACTKTGHFDLAEEILEALIVKRPDWRLCWIQRANNAATRRDEASARQYWSAARMRFRRITEENLGYKRFQNSLSDKMHHIVDDYRDVAGDPHKALRHIDELNVSENGPRPLVAARHYAGLFPDSVKIHIALAGHMRNNIRFANDLTELLETTKGICQRFPISRDAWIEQARALICANRLEETASITKHIEKAFGRCSHTDELNAWITQAEGDHIRAKQISKQLLREQYSFAVHGQLKRFERIDSNQAPSLCEKILLFCVIRDEIDLLPWFFEYYRSIGVDWFFFVDNGSSDESKEFLCSQADTTVYWTDDNFHQASSGMRWINELIERHGDGNWCIFVDADEQLVVPGPRDKGLRQVVDHMRDHGDEVMFGFMLDMYPDKGDAYSLFKSGDDPQSFSPLFDSDYLVFGDWQSPYRSIEGGARDRLFNTTHRLRKAPIVWGGADVRYLTNHTTTAAQVSEVTGALLHYKILRESRAVGTPRALDVQGRLKNRSPHCKVSHDRYRQVLENIDLSDFPKSPSTLAFESASQLVECGLINAIPDSEPVTRKHKLQKRFDFIEGGGQGQRWAYQTENSIVIASRARVLAMNENWAAAATQWKNCFDRFPAQAQLNWYGGLAHALMFSERHKEAIQIYRQLVDIQGGVTPYIIQGLSRVFLDSGNSEDLVKEYQSGALKSDVGTVDDLDVVTSLVRSNRITNARVIFDLVTKRLKDALALDRCLSLIPILFDGSERTRRLLKCEEAVSERLDKFPKNFESDLLLIVQLGALLALRDYERFKSCSAKLDDSSNISGRLRSFVEVRRRLCNQGLSTFKPAKVFVIGLSKTGTSSLSTALDILGFSTVHFVNPLTREIISYDDFHLFDAFADTPVSFQFEEIFEQYPDAKFVYTKRPIQSWVASFTKHFANNLDAPDWDALQARINHPEGCRHGEIYRAIHNNLYCEHADAMEAYQHHDKRVNLFFQGERCDQLLKFDIFSGDGWSKLCDFVGKPVPSSPFPWKNKTTIEDTQQD